MGIEQERIIAGGGGRETRWPTGGASETLADYVGQPNVKTQMDFAYRLRASEARPWIMY